MSTVMLASKRNLAASVQPIGLMLLLTTRGQRRASRRPVSADSLNRDDLNYYVIASDVVTISRARRPVGCFPISPTSCLERRLSAGAPQWLEYGRRALLHRRKLYESGAALRTILQMAR